MKTLLIKINIIFKDPFNNNSKNPFYLLKNKFQTFLNLKNFENYFVDFQMDTFPKYAKQIFDEVGYGLRTNNTDLFTKNLNENVYFALREEKADPKNLTEDYLVKCFPLNTKNWEIVHSRSLFLQEVADDFSQSYAQITLKYETDLKKDNYIVFERCIANNYSFYNWKIFIINYEYFKKH